MNTSLSWIKAYVPNLDCTAVEYTDAMTLSGSKVEGFVDLGKNLEKIVVGEIVSIERHPDADKLIVCQCKIANTGNDEEDITQIVTGANNVTVGDKVPIVLDGGRVRVGHNGEMPEDGIKIKKGKLRGVLSNGMMCSLEELGADKNLYPDAPEHGIYILPKDAKVGEDAVEVIGLRDIVFEYEITSNRVDCYSVLGIAREAAATFGKDFVMPKVKETGNSEDVNDYLKVEIKDADLCTRYIARMVKNIKIEASPKWLQDRLRSSGIRPINNIVDITNYVMEEYGQPMHAFDYESIENGKIIIERAKDGDTFMTLDGVERKLDSDILMIKDGKKDIALAGIMGGENSKIKDDVRTMIFESATFNGTNTRLSAKRLGLRTDASGKFEKGLDPNNALEAMNRACHLIEELGAGEVVGGIVDIYPNKKEEKKIAFEPEKINKLLGTDISKEEMLGILTKLEFVYNETKNELSIPSFRQDIEYMADLAEEVARFYGYDKIATTLPSGESTIGGISDKLILQNIAREVAKFMGFSESMTYSFESPKAFVKLCIPEGDVLRKAIEISNPLGEDFSIMRTSPLNGLLTSLSTNYNRRNKNVKLFELANIYLPKELPLKELPDERMQFALGSYGEGDFYDMKGVVEEFLSTIRLAKRVSYIPNAGYPFLHPGRSAKLLVGDTDIGYMGELHPEVAQNYKIGDRVYLAVLDIPSILDLETYDIKYKGISKYPGMSRDISLVVPKDILAGQIEEIIEKNAGTILESYRLFDIYEGSQVLAGNKSMAYNIQFRHQERTLEDKEVAKAMENILSELAKIQVVLRE